MTTRDGDNSCNGGVACGLTGCCRDNTEGFDAPDARPAKAGKPVEERVPATAVEHVVVRVYDLKVGEVFFPLAEGGGREARELGYAYRRVVHPDAVAYCWAVCEVCPDATPGALRWGLSRWDYNARVIVCREVVKPETTTAGRVKRGQRFTIEDPEFTAVPKGTAFIRGRRSKHYPGLVHAICLGTKGGRYEDGFDAGDEVHLSDVVKVAIFDADK